MDFVYGFGVTLVQYTQKSFRLSPSDVELATFMSQPHLYLDLVLPILAIVDSVFASQLLICFSGNAWLTLFLKWCLQEHRPYWWVKITNYYFMDEKPVLLHSIQTCETMLGSPSMHTMTAVTFVSLILIWLKHIFNDFRVPMAWWCNCVVYPILMGMVGYVGLTRVYVAASFPHQCAVGAFLGLFMTSAFCIISDHIIWKKDVKSSTIDKFLIIAIVLGIIELFKEFIYRDQDWGVEMAQLSCQDPEWINPAASPRLYNLQSIGSIIGWLLTVSPKLARFRHYTRRRSTIFAFISSVVFYHVVKIFEMYFDLYNTNINVYPFVILMLYVIKPVYYLYGVPYISTYIYTHRDPVFDAPVRNAAAAL